MKKEQLISIFQKVRKQTEALCQPLAIEDYVIQSIEDVSPPKWHLAHSSWYFETFLLTAFIPNYQVFHPAFPYLFNSYYQKIGIPYPRARRGVLSRPRVEEIFDYRHHVDRHVLGLIDDAEEDLFIKISPLVILGLHHEQQHQELLLMDIKYNFSVNPLFPDYNKSRGDRITNNQKLTYSEMTGGIVNIGYHEDDFCFDNELPRHKTFLEPYSISNQLVTNADYLEFIDADGYAQPEWWLADGWECIQKNNWHAPLYWQRINNEWYLFTLNGLAPLNPAEPVSHVSYYEAEAFARWCGARLPTEEEWEHFVVANHLKPDIQYFMESGIYHPQVTEHQNTASPQQFYGVLWEWTASSYLPYPGYQPLKGALGEYNGKFMANQMVLRGGCCATPFSHIRSTYRNFFQPDKRWQFSGIRLANTLKKRGKHVCKTHDC